MWCLTRMACPKANVKFQLRRATALEWANTTRVLLDGEPGYDTTNNILKIGRNNTPWANLVALNTSGGVSGSDILYQAPPPPTNLVTTNNSPISISVSWTYPAQEQTAVFQERLPLILALNVELIHSGGTIKIIDNQTTSPFVYKSTNPGTTPINTVKLFPGTGTSRIVGTDYEYYNSNLPLLTGLSVRIWYTNYSLLAPNTASINVSNFTVPRGPPSAVRFVIPTLPNDSSSALIINFTAPQYANSAYFTDPSTTISRYEISITTSPNRSTQNKTRLSLGTATSYTELVAYAGTTYGYTIYAINSYGQESSLPGNISISLPVPFASTLAESGTTNEYFSNVVRSITSGTRKAVSSGITNVVRTFNNLRFNGSFPIGDVYMTGAITTNTTTFTSTSSAGTRPITISGVSVGTIVSPSAALDYWAARPDRAGTTGYYMQNNVITVNLNNISSLAAIDNPNQQNITLNTQRGSPPFNFYVSNITSTSSAPTILVKTLSYTPIFKFINGFKVCNTTQLTIEASADTSTLGKYFFPNDWVARFTMLGGVYTYGISKFYTKNTDTKWFITVPTPADSADPTIINAESTASAITKSLYYGELSGTVQMKNLIQTTSAQALVLSRPPGQDPLNNGNIFIDNNSYNLVQSDRILLQLPVSPATTVAGNLTPYNNNAPISSTNNIMVYDGKYTLAGSLPLDIISATNLNSNTRYATFGFLVLGGNYGGKRLAITISGLENPARLNIDSFEITSNAERFNIYYRFETQYTSTGSVDYRIPRGTYQLPDNFISANYTTGWISANTSFGPDVSTANYNIVDKTSIFNGLFTTSISGQSATFTAFQPQIALNSNSPPLHLYISVGGANSSKLRFTNCNYQFV